MMIYRPTPFLLLPGITVLILGIALTAGVYFGFQSRLHTLILGSLMLIIGYQMLLAWIHFGAFGAVYGVTNSSPTIRKIMNYHSLGRELGLGLVFLLGALAVGIKVLYSWSAVGFGALSQIQYAVIAMILAILGIQTIFSGVFLSLLLLNSECKAD
jgi:hypothetical protein